jgi:hypothetical protein
MPPGSTVGADKNYDTTDFVVSCRERGCTPHLSQNACREALDRGRWSQDERQFRRAVLERHEGDFRGHEA